MALSEDEVRAAIGRLRDPVLRLPLADTGMLHHVRLRRGGRVEATVALPTVDYPEPEVLAEEVKAAARNLAGVQQVDVVLMPMGEGGQVALAAHLRTSASGPATPPTSGPTGGPGGAAPPPIGHEQGRPNPFNRPGARTRLLGISSGKGGVGKSSVTVNTALALARKGHEVAILDADVYGPSVPGMMGIRRPPMVLDEFMIPPVAFGVRCISIGFFVADDQPVIWRGPMLHKALEQFLVDVFWGELDYLLIDMPPGTGDVALSMAQYLPRSEVFVVTTPQAAARRVAQRTAYMARKVHLPLAGVIENMSWFTGDDGKRYEIFGAGGGQELADLLSVPLLGRIPLVPQLRQGGDTGVPIMVSAPESEAAAAFQSIA
ncbi:MAG TPA: Mrp/NBP35 family ATP-binding protein, partial [Acidimicrobiales bacterium]